MIIKVDEEYRIIHGDTQTIIQKYRKSEKGEDIWANVAYMGTLLGALKRAFELSLCKHKKTEINKFVDNLDKTLQKYVSNLEILPSDIEGPREEVLADPIILEDIKNKELKNLKVEKMDTKEKNKNPISKNTLY